MTATDNETLAAFVEELRYNAKWAIMSPTEREASLLRADAIEALIAERDAEKLRADQNKYWAEKTETLLASAITERDAARETALEDAAVLIEKTQETTSNTAGGSRNCLAPRFGGNRMGLAYADAIRALKAKP